MERLIYTIFTRAKDALYVTYSTMNLSEKSESLVSVLGNITDFEKNEQISIENCTKILENETKNIIELPFTGDESVFLKSIIGSTLKLSATSVQNFLDVTSGGPRYFLTRNLLQFPQAKSENATYGSAIHKGLEDFFKDYKFRKTFNKEILFSSFTEYIKREGFSENIEKNLIARGIENLESLYPHLVHDYGEIHLEQRFNQEGGGTYLSDIRLTGAIDRIELTSQSKMIVTDYKTGSSFATLE